MLLPAAENLQRLNALHAALEQRGLTFIEACGESTDDSWEAEASVLVLGLDRHCALSLAQRFEQNAIVASGQDAVPQLLCLV